MNFYRQVRKIGELFNEALASDVEVLAAKKIFMEKLFSPDVKESLLLEKPVKLNTSLQRALNPEAVRMVETQRFNRHHVGVRYMYIEGLDVVNNGALDAIQSSLVQSLNIQEYRKTYASNEQLFHGNETQT